jgi:hypothetical protein
MMIPAIGYLVSLLGASLVMQLRVRYLERASHKVYIEKAPCIQLVPAKWAYAIPLLGLTYGFWFLADFVKQHGGLISICLGLFCISVGIWLIWNLSKTQITISDEGLVYKEGNRHREILATDVIGVGFYWFSFRIRLRWQQEVSLPTWFKSSEVVLAYLRRACATNRSGDTQKGTV